MKKKVVPLFIQTMKPTFCVLIVFINLLILEALLDVVKVGWLMRLTILHLSYF
jgi:hypothetical protein